VKPLRVLLIVAVLVPAICYAQWYGLTQFDIMSGGAADSITFDAVYTSQAIPVHGASQVQIQLYANNPASGVTGLSDSTVRILVAGALDTSTFVTIAPDLGGADQDTMGINVTGAPTGNVLLVRNFFVVPLVFIDAAAVRYVPQRMAIGWVKVQIRTKRGPAAAKMAMQSFKNTKLRVMVERP
jgi:hypothetical protein